MKLDLMFEDQSVVTLVEKEKPPAVQLYMQKEDRDVYGYIRSCAPCPAVFPLKNDPHALMGEQWQYYIRASNYGMTLEDAYLLLDDHLAFANFTGFLSLNNPGDRADYFFRRNLSGKAPALDKVRTCSRCVLTGTEGYSLVQALREVIDTAKNIMQKSFMGNKRRALIEAATSVNVLNVLTFDSRKNPPLKPGRSYPSRVEDANIDDYLYNPREHRWMFLVANIVNRSGEVVQFPRGALYSWFEEGRTIGSFMPHVSNHGYGAVQPPLSNFLKLPMGAPVPSPYRRNA